MSKSTRLMAWHASVNRLPGLQVMLDHLRASRQQGAQKQEPKKRDRTSKVMAVVAALDGNSKANEGRKSLDPKEIEKSFEALLVG